MAVESDPKIVAPSNESLLAELRGSGGGAGADDAAGDDAPDEDLDDTEGPDEETARGEADPDDLDDEDLDEDPEDDDPDAEADPEDDADELATKDPELAKRLRVIRQTEQRQRTQLAGERAAFERERSEFRQQSRQVIEGQQRFEQLSARVRLDPVAVLTALGVGQSDDDWEYVAQQAIVHSKKYADQKEYRTAAQRARESREAAEASAANAKRIADLEKKLTERDQQTAAERDVERYFARVTRKADDSTPRVKALIASRPKYARQELAKTALALGQKLGGMPTAKQLLAAHEKKIARQLRIYGVAGETGAKPANAKSAGAATNGAKKPAAAAAQPDDGQTITIPSRDELLRELTAQRAR